MDLIQALLTIKTQPFPHEEVDESYGWGRLEVAPDRYVFTITFVYNTL